MASRKHRAPLELPPISRKPRDDQSWLAVQDRLCNWEMCAGKRPTHVEGLGVPFESTRGKIENLVGFAQVPLGIAGPLRVDTGAGKRVLYVPLATTEGALVASYSRGMRLLAAGGFVRSRVVRERLTQAPVLVYASAERAMAAAEVGRKSLARFQRITSSTTSHGALVDLAAQVIGRRLVLQLGFTTGDAIGINMAARATDLCAADLARRTKASERYVHGVDVEKRANARALVEGRGRSVVAEARVPRAALAEIARTTPEALVAIQRTYTTGFAHLGTQNWLVQSANGIAAAFLALGQDVAYVAECATGFLDLELDADGDLHAAATLPSLLVGTVGGGTDQGTARECLELLGCFGAGHANTLAEILGATVLAGDLSLMSAFCSHEFVSAHERLGRNRPGGSAAAARREVPRVR